MRLQVKTPPTKITATCCFCGLSAHVYGMNSVLAVEIFKYHGWHEDGNSRPICPDCYDKIITSPPDEFQVFTAKGQLAGAQRQKAWEVFNSTIDTFLESEG